MRGPSIDDFPIGASVTAEELSTNPHPKLHELRRAEPVSYVPALDAWLVTARDLAVEVMIDDETFTVDDPRFSTQQVIGPSMLSTDGAEHRRHREPFSGSFRARPVREVLADWVEERSLRLLEQLEPAGEADLRAEFAGPLAADVMTRILDMEGVSSADLLAWYETIVDAVDAITRGGAPPESGAEAFGSLTRAVQSSWASSRLLSRLEGDLSLDEVVSNVAVLLFGGIVTSESTTASALHFLLHSPGAWERVAADRSLVPAAVEEAMRLEPAAAAVDRYATRDCRLGEARIPAGDLVRISISASNRDPATFDDPDHFDLDRPNSNAHLAFARGPHVCLGIHVARLESTAAVRTALDVFPDLAAFGPASPVTGLVFRAPEHVRARW